MMSPPDCTVEEMKRIKSYFPFRIVFCVFVQNEWQVYAKTTKHTMNNFLRQGLQVWKI